jgi:transposase-like protein
MSRPRGPSIPIDQIEAKMAELIDLVRRGASPELAAGAVGVNPSTWFRWRQRARNGDEPYATIMADIIQAEAQFLCEVQIDMHANAKLLPHAWILERRRPDRFSIVDKLRTRDDDGPTTQTDEDRIAGLLGRWEDSGAAGELEADGPIDVEWTSTGEADS